MDGLRQFVAFRSFVFSLWTPSKRQSSTISAMHDCATVVEEIT
jgi:hypothetical protein